jgi:hypothetical protein
MTPIRRFLEAGDMEAAQKAIHRLAVLVQLLLAYIVVASAITGFIIFGLIDANNHRAEDVRQGLGTFICGAGLARETSVINAKTGGNLSDNVVSDHRAALGYFRILSDLGIGDGDIDKSPRDAFGESCPYKTLQKEAGKVAIEAAKSHAR